MPEQRPLPGPFNPGDTYPGAGDLNKIVNAIAAMMTGTGGVDVKLYGNRIVIDGKQQQQPIVPGFSNYMQQLVVVEELDDCLRCLPFTQPNNGTINIPQVYTSPPGDSNYIYVAKPYYLQRTPWDGKSFTQYGVTYTITFTGLGVRTLNPGSITQNILPAYLPGDLIVAGAAVTGQYIPGESQPIGWMDLNEAGRTWQTVTSSKNFSYIKLVWYVTSGSYVYTPILPGPGYTLVGAEFFLVAGGGGGGARIGGVPGGGGGGGGTYWGAIFPFFPGTILYVGAGGAAGLTPGTDGSRGQDTSLIIPPFINPIYSTGGFGGKAGSVGGTGGLYISLDDISPFGWIQNFGFHPGGCGLPGYGLYGGQGGASFLGPGAVNLAFNPGGGASIIRPAGPGFGGGGSGEGTTASGGLAQPGCSGAILIKEYWKS